MHVARWPVLAAASVPLIAVALLVPFLSVDPARGVTFSNSPFSDEAWNLVGARNLVLFGQPATDEWRTWLLAAPYAILNAITFKVFGISLEVARAVSVLSVAATGLVMVIGLGPVTGVRNAWVAAIGYVTSSLILYYGRLAFLEPIVGLLLAVGVVTLVPASAGRNPARWGVLGGVSLAVAIMTKGLAIGPVGAIGAVVVVTALRNPWARRWLAGGIPAGAILLLGWAILLLYPNRQDVATILTVVYPAYDVPTRLHALLRHLLLLPFRDHLLGYALPLLTLSAIGSIRLLLTNGRPAAGLAAVAALAASAIELGVVDYQPNRYAVAFLPLAALAAAWALPGRPAGAASPGAAVSQDAAGRRVPVVATALIALLVATPGLAFHAVTIRAGGSRVVAMQAAARGALPAGALVAGGYAPLVALELPVMTIVPFKSVNGGDLYADGVRYLVWTDHPPDFLRDRPEVWAGREAIACFVWGVRPTTYCLDRLPDPTATMATAAPTP